MKIGLEINGVMKPWMIPNFIVIQNGDKPTDGDTSFHIREVEAQALSIQCEAFRADVFKKAGKKDPRL